MKRSATDVLRRGFDMTVANWPVIVVRIAESIVLMILAVGAAVAAIVPLAVAAGLSLSEKMDPDSIAAAFVQHWMLLVYALLIIGVLLIVLVAIHSFFDGGVTQIFVDAEHAGAKSAFNMDRFLAGGRKSWWAIFWIYNIVWSIAGLILLVPLVATIAVMLAVRDDTGRIFVGCAGLLLSLLIIIPISIVAALWTQKAIAVCVARSADAADSMRIAREEMFGDFGRHLVVALVVFAVSLGGAMAIGAVTAPLALLRANDPSMFLFTVPVQVSVSFIQSIFSAATTAWLLASFVALTEERGSAASS